MDFAALLVIAAVITGGIWMLDSWVLSPRRGPLKGTHRTNPVYRVSGTLAEEAKLPWYVDISRSFFPIIIVVLVLRSFILEPFRIPSGSMMPTLLAGDFILVSKFAFGIRLPVINTKIIDSGSPQRGDVAVFRYPEDPALAYIKRVVGLPGDRIVYRDKQLYINDKIIIQAPLPPDQHDLFVGYELRTEQLGETQHAIQIKLGNSWEPSGLWPGLQVQRNESGHLLSWSYEVPADHYFVLGDNRDNSRDSRFWGPLPEDHLIGRAFFIWMNWDCITFKGQCHRIGTTIR